MGAGGVIAPQPATKQGTTTAHLLAEGQPAILCPPLLFCVHQLQLPGLLCGNGGVPAGGQVPLGATSKQVRPLPGAHLGKGKVQKRPFKGRHSCGVIHWRVKVENKKVRWEVDLDHDVRHCVEHGRGTPGGGEGGWTVTQTRKGLLGHP